MSLQYGIVDLLNVGKSALFNALTKASIATGNYPLYTVGPNTGVVEVPGARLQALADIIKPERVLSAVVEFVDTTGLVAGASKREGFGSQFLISIRKTDAIMYAMCCFKGENVIHVVGRVDPVADIEAISTELALINLSTMEKTLQRYIKAAKSGNDKEAAKLVAMLEKAQKVLDEAKPVHGLNLTDGEWTTFKSLYLITARLTVYVVNVREDGFEDNPYLNAVRNYVVQTNLPVVTVYTTVEAEITDPGDVDKAEFLADTGTDEPGLNRVIHAVFKLLGL